MKFRKIWKNDSAFNKTLISDTETPFWIPQHQQKH
jgi:hypothetical protein